MRFVDGDLAYTQEFLVLLESSVCPSVFDDVVWLAVVMMTKLMNRTTCTDDGARVASDDLV